MAINFYIFVETYWRYFMAQAHTQKELEKPVEPTDSMKELFEDV
jgi:hypothetical protein